MMRSQGGSDVLCEYEDILMKKTLHTHAPEDCQVDSAPLLDLAENIFLNIAMSSVLTTGIKLQKETARENRRSMQDIRVYKAVKELGMTVHHMSCEMLQNDSTERPPNATTSVVLESLEKHQWSTKLAIVVAALASSYGNYWLIAQFCHTNPLALSLATIKGLRSNSTEVTTLLKNQLKALRTLLEKMVRVTKCVMGFEVLPLQYVSLDYEAMAMMRAQVHIASYWVIRSSVECASQITSSIASGFEQAKVTLAAWELWSLTKKLSYIHDCLRNKFDAFSQQIEKKVHLRLLNLFEEVHTDNHEVLYTLFALKDDFPLRASCSQEKVGVDVLRNKVVILFISCIDLYPEKLLLITQQLQNKLDTPQGEYEIVWFPVSLSAEVVNGTYNRILELIPWYSIAEPSKVSTSVTKFIQEVWHFQGEPIMVVLDPQGKILSLDSYDMVAIWGSRAYPFTNSRERELWEEEIWSMKLIVGNIDPLLSYWMEDGKLVCLYGSNDLEWIRELSRRMKDISQAGIMVELIYVGNNMHKQTRETLTRVMEEKLSRYLSHEHISIFWLRLESMQSSRLRLGYSIESDFITREINSLLTSGERSTSWLILSEGASTEVFKLLGNQVLESLSNLQLWGQSVRKLGFLGALRRFLDPSSTTEPCDYSIITPYSESSNEKVSVCKKCKSLMERHIVYQCGTC